MKDTDEIESTPTRQRGRSKPVRLALAVVVLAAAVALLPPIPPNDSVAYWAAARLALSQTNPYDLDSVIRIEKAAGYPYDNPLTLRNPPWTLALVLPLGLLPFQQAAMLWTLLQVAAVVGATVIVWKEFGGGSAKVVLGLAMVFTFPPVIDLIANGQITGFLALGLALLLRYTRSGNQIGVGFAIALLSLKPHLLGAVWGPVALFAIYHRWWKALGTAAGTVGGLLAIAVAVRPTLIAEYVRMTSDEAWRDVTTPTLSGWLRHSSGADAWLQYVAVAAVGIAGAAIYLRARERWDWRERLPVLVCVSLLAAPYGFFFDQCLYLIPLIVVVIAMRRGSIHWTLVAMYAAGAALLQVAVASHATAWIYAAASAFWAILFFVAQRVTARNNRVFPQGAS